MHEAGTKTVALGLRRGFAASPRRVAEAARELKTSDVVHLHGYNFVFEAAARSADRPVVFTEHGNFGHARRPTLAGRAKAWRKAQFLHSVQALAANSEYSAQRLTDLYGIDREAISVVYNGVALGRGASRAHVPSRDGALRVALVGRLADVKRPELLIEALRLVQNPRRFVVEIVGDGPLGPMLRRRTAAYELTETVRFVGYSSRVASILSWADVLVHPGQGESFGLVVVEAALEGALPVVFTDGGGALEVIPPDAIVVSGVQDLAGALDNLVGSATLSSRARAERAAWARDRFPISRTACAYQSLYELAIERLVTRRLVAV
jgi:glycosyltransferase involved in cell wall biosynthesis